MKPTIIPLAGILAKSEEQHGPLGLERYGQVEHLDYRLDPFGESSFRPDAVASLLAERLEDVMSAGRQVTVFGSSIGGNLAAFGVEKLVSSGVDTSNLRVVIVDSPAGQATLKDMPDFLSPKFAGSSAFNGLLRVAGPMMLWAGRRDSGLPKDHEISVPETDDMRRIAGRTDFTEREWRDWVKATARSGLMGHDAGVWADQLSWMIRIGIDGSLDRAVSSLQHVDTIYVECDYANVVVQPAAKQYWLDRMGWANEDASQRWRTVSAVHCGYLQQYAEFKPIIDPLFT